MLINMSRLLDDDVIHLTIQYRTSSTTCLFDFCDELKIEITFDYID